MTENAFVPIEPILPGEYLRDEIGERNWSLMDAASHSALLTPQQLTYLIAGKMRVTRAVAYAIAEMFGQEDAEVWRRLQDSYDLACAQRTAKANAT